MSEHKCTIGMWECGEHHGLLQEGESYGHSEVEYFEYCPECGAKLDVPTANRD